MVGECYSALVTNDTIPFYTTATPIQPHPHSLGHLSRRQVHYNGNRLVDRPTGAEYIEQRRHEHHLSEREREYYVEWSEKGRIRWCQRVEWSYREDIKWNGMREGQY